MPTRAQIITIQTAKRALKLTDPAYRMILKNAGGVTSSKDLTNEGFDQVMAVLEESGFRSHPSGPTYWRDKAAVGGHRAVNLLARLAEESRYPLDAMCRQFSGGRTSDPAELTRAERWKLIEMYKSSNAREARPQKTQGSALGLRRTAADEVLSTMPQAQREAIDELPF